METLVKLNREQGVTIIVVTHETDIAAYASRVVTMRDGQIISDRRAEAHAGTVPPDDGEQQKAAFALFHPHEETPPAARPSQAFLAFGMMILSVAAQAINRNRMRSALTMLGVFIGVAALIAMVAVGQGANEAVRKQIESLGTNLMVVVPGAVATGGFRGGAGSASTLTIGDVQAIRREAPSVAKIAYLLRQQGQVQYGSQDWSTMIQGVSAGYPPITNWQVADGRAITQDDESKAALVVLLGQTVVRQLFAADENPIGALMLVKGVTFRVIGTLSPKGQSTFGQDQDDLVMIPFTTAERKVLGVAAPSQALTQLNWVYLPPPNPYNLQSRITGYVNQIYVQAVSSAEVQRAIDQLTAVLNRRHRILPGQTADFAVRNLSQIAEAAEGSSRIMALLLAAVASISLVVGGIGIMNILLVSVTERTREIGLRMAIGARRLHVLLQFLAEAVFLSVSGGIAGILLGIGFALAIPAVAGWPAPISLWAVGGGFLFSAAVGVFFGYYPARKAASLDPIEALRYE